LDGGAGADTMAGGGGNDVYVVDDPGDVVVESPDGGDTDIIISTVTYTLPDNVEVLQLNGGRNIDGNRNDASNFLQGNPEHSNGLRGLGGDDILVWRASGGNDTLDGGEGHDIAVFDGAHDAANGDHFSITGGANPVVQATQGSLNTVGLIDIEEIDVFGN